MNPGQSPAVSPSYDKVVGCQPVLIVGDLRNKTPAMGWSSELECIQVFGTCRICWCVLWLTHMQVKFGIAVGYSSDEH